jgi:hypothetical protein
VSSPCTRRRYCVAPVARPPTTFAQMRTHTPERSKPSALPGQPHTYPCAHSRSISARIRVIPTGTAQEFVSVSPISPRSVHRRGSPFPIRPATSSPWVDAGQDRSSLYPVRALASLLMLRVLLCPTARTHTPVWGTSTLREEPRRRAVFVARGFALVATASPSFLLSPSWLSHRHSPAPTLSSPSTPRAKPKHPDHDHLVALFHLAAKDVLPTWAHERQAKSVHVFVHMHARRRTPRRATAELAAVAKPPSCLRAQVRTWTQPLAGQCSLTHARIKPRS